MKSHAMPSGISPAPSLPTTCPICSASNIKPCPPGRDRLFRLAPGLFALFHCQSCGCIFQHPFPDSGALAKFYPQEYWWSGNSPKRGKGAPFFSKLEKWYRELVTEDHARFLDQCAAGRPGSENLLLDIGCGNGTFLHVARAHGFKPHGMDESARAAEIAGTEYGIPVRQGGVGSRIWEGTSFDFITMFHVLEHLPDPRFALEYVRGLLRPSGLLIIQVPNVSSAQARIFGRFWYGLDVPRHVINYTPEAVRRLFNGSGFEFQLSTLFSLRDNPAQTSWRM